MTDSAYTIPDDLDAFEPTDAGLDRLLEDVRRPLVPLRDKLREAAADGCTGDELFAIVRDHYRAYLVVDVGLSAEQLDHVIFEGSGHGPDDVTEPVTVRSELMSTARDAALAHLPELGLATWL